MAESVDAAARLVSGLSEGAWAVIGGGWFEENFKRLGGGTEREPEAPGRDIHGNQPERGIDR